MTTPRVHLLLTVLAALLLAGCQTHSARRHSAGVGFVQVEGTQFRLDGKPYYFVGTNFWYGAYLGATSLGRERLKRELDALRGNGITNLRVLASGEATALTRALAPSIHEAPGEYNEQMLRGLDVLLAEMAARDMRAVLLLNNFWQWSGGMAQYMAWLTGEPALDPDATGDWDGFMQNSAAFYREPQAQAWYQQLIRTLVTRVNTVTGQEYRDDPTIMSWQLANEPRPGSDTDSGPYRDAYLQWIHDTATFIKALAPQQLVSSGSEGAMGSARDLDLYRAAHSSPAVDYLTFHLWPKNWSWFDIRAPEASWDIALGQAKSYILSHIAVAQELNKPTVLEEFGIERDNGDYRPSSTTRWRDRFYLEVFSLIESQARGGAAIAGSNFWAWGGAGRAQSSNFIWRESDPFTGDPPQEPQGLNSVFDSDSSTLGIIAGHAEAMTRLRR